MVLPVFADVSEQHLSPEMAGLSVEGSGRSAHPEPEEEGRWKATAEPPGHRLHQLPDISTEDTRPSSSSEGSSHASSPKPQQKLLASCRRGEDESPDEREVQQKEPGQNVEFTFGTADDTMNRPASVQKEAKLLETMQVRTLQLTGLQNVPFKEMITSLHEETDGRVSPQRSSSLKAFWERDNSRPRILLPSEEEISETVSEASHDPPSTSNMEDRTNDSSHMETAAVTSEDSGQLPQTDFRLFAHLCQEDGTYRADPVMISAETDDCSPAAAAESQSSESQETISDGPSCENSRETPQNPEGKIPVPRPRCIRSRPRDDRPANFSEFKPLWEEEYPEPAGFGLDATRTKVASAIVQKGISPQSDPRPSSECREKCESERPASPHKAISVAFKSLTVTVKGFVSQSPVKEPLSPVCPGDVQSACQRVTAHPDAQNRPDSYHTPRAKDQEDEVKRSPSKTCHPRVLPREPSGPNRSTDGSLFKAFPIDIDPRSMGAEEKEIKLSPVPRQSPSTEAEWTGSLQPKNSSQKTDNLRLARSDVPQDYQHYLGPHEKAFVPALPQEEAAAAEADSGRGPASIFRESVGSQGVGLTGENAPPGFGQNQRVNSSQDRATRVWSRCQEVFNSEHLIL